jgi:hypothetical protein
MMKKVSIYSSDFSDKGDWKDLLEELDFNETEREIIEEVELTITSSEIPDGSIEGKQY